MELKASLFSFGALAAAVVCGLSACGGSTDSTEDGRKGTGGGIALGGSGGGSATGGIGFGGSSNGGSGNGSGSGGGSAATGNGGGSGGPNGCGDKLTGTLRDFQQSHSDFEELIESDPGIVVADLGADGKPVYAGQAGNPTTSGQGPFDQWFRDTPGVNQSMPHTITLTQSGGSVWTYDNSSFFPYDGQGFGNEGNPHNYHFTYELHTKFLYSGGETFQFTGDDDLFVFINGKLAIDLGGVHGAESAQTDLDTDASALGISPGNVYTLDMFFAERHTTESNFRIDTTLTFVDCGSGGSGGSGGNGGSGGGSGSGGSSGNGGTGATGGGSGGTIPF